MQHFHSIIFQDLKQLNWNSITEIRLIILFAAKDGEALYSLQKQDQEPTVAQIMKSLLPNSDLNLKKQGKAVDH